MGTMLALFLDGPRHLFSAASRCLRSHAPSRQLTGLAAVGVAVTLLLGGGSAFADPAVYRADSLERARALRNV